MNLSKGKEVFFYDERGFVIDVVKIQKLEILIWAIWGLTGNFPQQ